MKLIPLTQGQFAIIDNDDFERVNQFKWYANKAPNTFYANRQVQINRKRQTIHLHRFILNLDTKFLVDHVDGNGLNNQKSNLRTCTNQENSRNKRLSKKGTSSFKGVHYDKKYDKFEAQIKINYNSNFIGYNTDELICAKFYDAVARFYFKEFAKCNFEIEYFSPMSIEMAKIEINKINKPVHKLCKIVIIHGIEYESISIGAKVLNLNYNTVLSRVKSKINLDYILKE
jgi:hypothetical protein